MPRKTPQFTEYTFATMCADHGATCNKSQEDETGWDYLIEFPAQAVPGGLPIDIHPAPRSCLVQVKSTVTGVRRTRIKVSNALRFAKSPLPCFIVLFVFGREGGSPREIHVLHFWKDMIARTLETARRLEAAGDTSFHRHYIALSFEPAKAETNLLSHLETEVESVGRNYAEEKRRIFELVGFEESFGDGAITFGENVTLDDIVDAELGLRGPLEVSRFRFQSTRFGIPAQVPLADFDSGVVHIEAQSSGACTILLSSETGEGEIALDGEVFTPSQRDLPDEYLKLRVKASFVDLLVKPHTGESTINIKLAYTERLPLPDLAKFVAMRILLGSGPLDCQIWHKGVLLFGGQVSFPNLKTEPDWQIFQELTGHLTRHVAIEKLPPDLRVSVSDLASVGQDIVDFRSAASEPTLGLTGVLDDHSLSPGEPCSVFYACHLPVAGHTFYALLRRQGCVTAVNGKSVALALEAATHLTTLALAGSHESNSEFLIRELTRRAQGAGRRGDTNMLVLGDVTGRLRRGLSP